MFETLFIKNDRKWFQELSAIPLESITVGRQGCVLVDCKKDGSIPIVRTTTQYSEPAQNFQPIHRTLIAAIAAEANMDGLSFNNGLLEVYDSRYPTMGYHSDQALDLEETSYICLFSCYSEEKKRSVRTLEIKDKSTGEQSKIELKHCSVVLFSVATNSAHLHRIVLTKRGDSQWLGITLRLSKTYIHFQNKIPYFVSTGRPLELATEDQQREFYKQRAKENKSIGKHNYSDINFTISKSDTIPPALSFELVERTVL